MGALRWPSRAQIQHPSVGPFLYFRADLADPRLGPSVLLAPQCHLGCAQCSPSPFLTSLILVLCWSRHIPTCQGQGNPTGHGLRLCPEGPASSGCQPILPFLPKAFLWLQPSPGLQDSRQEPLADEKPISRGHGVPTLPPWPPLGHSTAPAPWEILPLPLGSREGLGCRLLGCPLLVPISQQSFPVPLCAPLCPSPASPRPLPQLPAQNSFLPSHCLWGCCAGKGWASSS